MKRIILKTATVSLLSALMIVLSACGGGGGGTLPAGGEHNEPSDATTSTEMKLGKVYTLEEGDTITKKSDDTVVVLTTDVATGDTTARLTKGSAVIE